MKEMLLFIATISMVGLLDSCTSAKTYATTTDWDADKNGSIGRSEFVDAYMAQRYFNKWSGGGSSVGYQELYNSLFDSMDADKDQKLSNGEFNSQIKLFYFGLFSESFAKWDDDKDSSVSKNEFINHVSSSNLASIWDTNGDKRISEREMAGGMFYLCDADSNGAVSETELDNWKKNR